MTVKVLISPFLMFVVNISGNHQMTLRKEEHVKLPKISDGRIQGQCSGTDTTVSPSAGQESRVPLYLLNFS